MLNKEPAVIVNGLSELLRQILPLLVIVGLVELPPDRLAAWISIIGLVLAFVSTTILRTTVVPTVIADKQMEIAKASSIDTPTERIIQQAKESV